MLGIEGTKYITITNDRYVVRKKINGKQYHFGSYDNLETAIYYRDYFQSKGWENCLNERNNYTDTENSRNYDYSMRYIRESGNHYRIDKVIDKEKYNFGTYDTLEEAKFFRDYFEETDWPLTERLKYTNKPFYISGNPSRGYEVRKIIDGECLHMGKFDDYETAAREVEYYKKCNWDLDAICECCDDTVDGETLFLEGKKARGSFFQEHNNGRNDIFLWKRSKKI